MVVLYQVQINLSPIPFDQLVMNLILKQNPGY